MIVWIIRFGIILYLVLRFRLEASLELLKAMFFKIFLVTSIIWGLIMICLCGQKMDMFMWFNNKSICYGYMPKSVMASFQCLMWLCAFIFYSFKLVFDVVMHLYMLWLYTNICCGYAPIFGIRLHIVLILWLCTYMCSRALAYVDFNIGIQFQYWCKF